MVPKNTLPPIFSTLLLLPICSVNSTFTAGLWKRNIRNWKADSPLKISMVLPPSLFFRNFISLCFSPIFLLSLKMMLISNSVFLLKVLTNTVIRLIDLISLAAWKRFFLRFYPAKLPFLPLILSFLMPAGAARRSFLAGPSAERRTKPKDVHISGILKFLFNL